MTSLLDVLKETDLRVGLTPLFTSATGHETLDRETLQRRLLLCLYGLGTNTGLKRVADGEQGTESQADLRYVRRPVHPQGGATRGHRRGGQRDLPSPPARDLGRGHDRLCLGLQEVRRLGPEPADGVAHPLPRAGRDDLLAR
jgi:Tn3 transposase DDE domain